MQRFVLGIIPDGNRRYARKYGLPFEKAYRRGIEVAKNTLSFLCDLKKVSHVYFYTLSLENLKKRSPHERKTLLKLLEKEAEEVAKKNPWGARVKIIGRLEELPKSTREKLTAVEKKTEGEKGINIALAVAYSGRAEIVDAVRKLVEKRVSPDDIDEHLIYRHLYAPDFPPPDLIIRTSGEQRISGFLPYQSVYSEFLFYPKLWPEMETEDVERIIENFEGRERRFGK